MSAKSNDIFYFLSANRKPQCFNCTCLCLGRSTIYTAGISINIRHMHQIDKQPQWKEMEYVGTVRWFSTCVLWLDPDRPICQLCMVFPWSHISFWDLVTSRICGPSLPLFLPCFSHAGRHQLPSMYVGRHWARPILDMALHWCLTAKRIK